MSTEYSNINRRCATCAFWCGSRSLKGKKVIVSSPSEHGKCSSPKGAYALAGSRAEILACGAYQLWPALK